MWQKLVLTAGSDAQNEIFGKQIAKIPISDYCEQVEIVTDESPGIRIGSGGATLSVIRKTLESGQNLDNYKMLLVHSGGLSQRVPHLSPYGKIFGLLPNKKTILESKLMMYKDYLVENLPNTGGIMISASDVLESFQKMKDFSKSDSDMILFAHSSSSEVAMQHGVFVMDEETNALKRVLQKPSYEELSAEVCLLGDAPTLTDSCYFMSWDLCRKLMAVPMLRKLPTQEICCYADFMRPLGSEPKLDYIEKTKNPILREYRKALAQVFSLVSYEICRLGTASFFHFGTYLEYLEHVHASSECREACLINGMSDSRDDDSKSEFVEFSSIDGLDIGNECFVSGIDASGLKDRKTRSRIPDKTVVFTLALKEGRFVTVQFGIETNAKDLYGTGKESLWDSPIFKIADSRTASLIATLEETDSGGCERISMGEAVSMHDLETDLAWRDQFTRL